MTLYIVKIHTKNAISTCYCRKCIFTLKYECQEFMLNLFFFEGEKTDGDQAAAPAPAPTPAPAPEEKPQPTPTKTPKSPAKSEPPTPSKKMKEIPPIPTFDLYMVLAAGNYENGYEYLCCTVHLYIKN